MVDRKKDHADYSYERELPQGKIEIKMDLVLNACISSSQNVEDGGSGIQGHSQLYGEFKKPCFKRGSEEGRIILKMIVIS